MIVDALIISSYASGQMIDLKKFVQIKLRKDVLLWQRTQDTAP